LKSIGQDKMKVKIPYKPREYQQGVVDAFIHGDIKRVFLVWHRRCGKDLTSVNLLVVKALRETGIYYYVFPTYTQGKKILWDNKEMMQCIPDEICKAKNHSEMKIELINGSIIQVIGSDRYDSLRGTNPRGVVMSEYAFQHPLAWETLRPILAVNGGWAIFNTTPNGKNHAYDLWEYAKERDDWYTSRLGVGDTAVLTDEILESEKESMDPQMFLQEYYCSWDIGAHGAYYSDQMKWLRENHRIISIPYDPALPVITYWDIGQRDFSAVWFAQKIGSEVRFIDYYEAANKGFDEICTAISTKDYNIIMNWMPHDFKHREYMIGESRFKYAKRLGFKCDIVPNIGKMEGIDVTRRFLKKCFFDKDKCKQGIKCLEHYHKEYDEINKVFMKTPKHDWSSHAADAMRYSAVVHRDILPEEEQVSFLDALFQEDNNGSNPFCNF